MLFFKGFDHLRAVVQAAQWDPLVGFAAVAFLGYQELMLSTVATILQNFVHLVLFLTIDNGGVWRCCNSRAEFFRRWQVVSKGVEWGQFNSKGDWCVLLQKCERAKVLRT